MSIELLIHKGRGPAGGSDWQLGDVVCAKQSPASWGREEGPPKFFVVTVTGVNLDDPRVQELIEPHQHEDTGLLDPKGNPIQRLRVRRRRSILVSAVPAAIRTALQTTGRVTVTAGQVANFLAAVRDR